MNERIKDLAKQAGYYLYDLTETHEIKTVETDSADEWITLQKFAELIVRECMKEAMDEMIPDEDIAHENDPLIREYLKGSNQGIVDAVIRFRNHFGVEE